MIQHERPYWSPQQLTCSAEKLPQANICTSLGGTNKPNETLHVDNANEGGCAIHFALFKSPTLNYYTTSIIHSGT